MSRKTTDILDENTQRTKGADALTSNIAAAKAVSDIVKTTLGPMGMDKMLIDNFGNTTITNDGVKILREMEIEHPGAKLLVEVAKTQEAEVGDGTTSAVILAGEFLSQAEKLLKQKIHPTNIVRGYKLASIEALKILDRNSTQVNVNDEKILREICQTAMTGKVAEYSKDTLSEIIFEAVSLVKDDNGIAKNKIKIQKATGGDISESSIIKGIVLDKEAANVNMVSKVEKAKILLIDFALEIKELEADAKVNINSMSEYEDFLQAEQDYLKALVNKIKSIGANVVICQKGIDDSVAYYLAKENILAIRRTRKSDMEKLSYALNKNIISIAEDLKVENLGLANLVHKKEVLGENYIFVEGCQNPKAITLFLKASTQHILDEIERAVEDCLGDLNAILKSKKIVAGGGAIDTQIYAELAKFSKTFSGKDQIVINAYAESFLCIPKTLCENSGFDEIDTITKLISNHEKGMKNSGINGFTGICEDTQKIGIIEPINVKSQAIKSATESASMILRIDDIIAAKKLSETGDSRSGMRDY